MLEAILKYQEIEQNIDALENELKKSKEFDEANKAKKLLSELRVKVEKLEDSAKTILARYQKATAKFAQYTKKLEALEAELAAADDSKIALYEKAYKDFSTVSISLDKEIAYLYSEMEQINADYLALIMKSKEVRATYNKYKLAFEKQKAEKKPILDELKANLDKQKKVVDEKLLKIYLQKKEGRIFPVYAALASNKCSGCRMEVSASKLGAMKTNEYGVIECENCGRFIYKKSK